ncbi:MAG: glutamate-1-semialdehyde 2,1-aminomutase [Clostridiales bacterium]|nr:glutamate-1-semialdehyde 2,1-aminomutase [Clostridiales bacterium]
MSLSDELFGRGKKVMPGGVNSPVRAFGSVERNPLFIEKASGSKIYDADGNEYIDFVNSWGPLILGHCNQDIVESVKHTIINGFSFGLSTEREVLIAELICEIVPNVEMIRMVNSGTEAVMSALRLARGFTGRDKVIKFEGCYHGHCDSMLVKAGSGALTSGEPDSAGIIKATAKYTLIAEYNNLESVEKLFKENKDEIACVIVEPVAANMGVIPPKEGFLEGLRKLCDENKALLIFDEVITGFRIALGGAQEYFGVSADIVTFGKIIGGGMPVGAYGGKREIMERISPVGNVYQAGTLSGNPIAMAAGYKQLTMLRDNKDILSTINMNAEYIANEMRCIIEKYNVSAQVNQVGSLISVFFAEEEVDSYKTAVKSDKKVFSRFFNSMLDNGIYIAPSQFEAMFISFAHEGGDFKKFIEVFEKSISELR